MRITYRTRQRLRRLGIVSLILLTVAVIIWLCSVVWLERYVIYTREGASVDFDLPLETMPGAQAVPPVAKGSVSIYYNEGSDSIETNREMTAVNGYYIDYNALKSDMAGVMDDIKYVKAGTPVMIELKGNYGTVYYSSNVSGAALSQSVQISQVDELIEQMKTRGFYMIAKISAFRDYDFGNKNVSSGLYMKSRAGLWMDPDGYFWLNPTSTSTLGWITALTMELKNMGFHEVVLDNFQFPTQTDKYIFDGDMQEAIAKAAQTMVDSCGSDKFVLSFGVPSTDFPLPEGRTRMYLANADAQKLTQIMEGLELEKPETRVVFVADTNDTRFDQYSILRPISTAELLEAQKDDIAAQASEESTEP